MDDKLQFRVPLPYGTFGDGGTVRDGDIVKSPSDMRRAMQKMAVTGRLSDDDPWAYAAPSFTAVIVRNVLQAARYEGWSGEDTYTILAWQLMHAAERHGRRALEEAVLAPPRAVIIPDPRHGAPKPPGHNPKG